MSCKKCDCMICSQALRQGKCKICKKMILTPHSPCYQFCEECAKKNKICQQCGSQLGIDEIDLIESENNCLN